MEDRETPRMGKCGESKRTRIMMATVPHVTSGLGLRKFQADGFLFDTSVQEGDWDKGPISTDADKKSLSFTGVRKPDRPVCSE